MDWGALAGGVANLTGSIIQGISAKRNTIRNNRANRELAEYQYNTNMDAWREQNEYNTPANQMQRYRDAGLNPYLIYGQGSNGNATSVPQYDAPHMDAVPATDFGIGNAVGQGFQIYMANAQFEEQKKNNLAQREAIEMRNLTETFKQLRYGFDLARDKYEFNALKELGMSNAAVMAANVRKTQQEIAESTQRVLNLEQEYSLKQVMRPLEVEKSKLLLEQLKQDNNFKKFEYNLREDLKLLPGMTGWDRLIAIALQILGPKDWGKENQRLLDDAAGRRDHWEQLGDSLRYDLKRKAVEAARRDSVYKAARWAESDYLHGY